ncbi:hypothetical protein SKAU_G00341670 [Synaphobranchus kaupii]|uniref:Uncharacterized protein n=1 Tax=Synaphobranchus kaupii TaxID=118154 RepID=A0A9Q1EN45_SYNKA|nr:hypothetical protein SKAU_G00341670 [Synaphobranchus kaupii]
MEIHAPDDELFLAFTSTAPERELPMNRAIDPFHYQHPQAILPPNPGQTRLGGHPAQPISLPIRLAFPPRALPRIMADQLPKHYSKPP